MDVRERRLSMSHTAHGPWLIENLSARADPAKFIDRERERVRERLSADGAILLRGFAVATVQDFDRCVDALGYERMDYLFGSTPRTQLGNRIYTATEYPASQEIVLHNENSYHRVWPRFLAFCCLQAAESGGETPIADMEVVTARIDAAVLDEFAARGVKYVRHYRPYVDVPWQQVFGTDDRARVASLCLSEGVQSRWLDDETLRTEQVSQGVIEHPRSKRRTIFNQAHLFHVSSLGHEAAQALISHYGLDQLPRHCHFGDGGEMSIGVLENLRAAFRGSSWSYPWRNGDVLLLDNMRFAHGRRSYKGPRRVVTALLEPCSEANLKSTIEAK